MYVTLSQGKNSLYFGKFFFQLHFNLHEETDRVRYFKPHISTVLWKIEFFSLFRNPNCTKKPPLPSPCDPRCSKTGGKCNAETGKCVCCKDFSGPHPVYDSATHTISADYCDTYCPYTVAGKR